MKRFLGTFLACLVVSWAFLFFGGAMIFENFWALLVFCALVLTVLILAFEGQGEQIEKLEKRIAALEQAVGRDLSHRETGEQEETT